MSDDTTPLADPVEARLRSALTAEADRHTVTPDFEGLRVRGDRTIVDLDLSPRRNRARLLAVAAVVTLVVGALGVLAVQGGDDAEPVITDEPPATGYYLPGDGWTVTEIFGAPLIVLPGTERTVELGTPQLPGDDPTQPDLGSASIVVSRITDEDPDLIALAEGVGLEGIRTLTRGSGAEARDYVLANVSAVTDGSGEPPPSPEEAADEGGTLLAAVDDLLLTIDWYGPVGEDDAIDLADRWWTSGGAVVALDPATGLDRVADVTYPGVVPTSVDEVIAFSAVENTDDLYADALLQVVVRVEAPDGWTGTYSLVAPDEVRPTGFDDPEGGAAAGLTTEEVGAPLPAEVGGPMPAWESSVGIVADRPGVLVGVARSSYDTDPMTAERARQLWAALAPASRQAWVAAGPDETAENGIPDRVWGETLAATDVTDLLGVFESVSDGEGEALAPMGGDVTVEPRDGTNPATGRAPAEVDRLVADAVLAFAGGPGPVDADLFAPSTTFGDEDDPGAEVSVAVEDVAAGADEAIATGPPTPAAQAWNVLWTVSPAEATQLVGEGDESCPPLAELATDPAVVVVLQSRAVDVDTGACADWAALVVRLDDQRRITSVEARVGP